MKTPGNDLAVLSPSHTRPPPTRWMGLFLALACGTSLLTAAPVIAATSATPQAPTDLSPLCALLASDDVDSRNGALATLDTLCMSAAAPGAGPARARLEQELWQHIDKPDQPLAVRCVLLRRVGLLGGEDSVAALERLTHDPQPQLRETSRVALQRIGGGSSIAALRRSYAQCQDPLERSAYIRSLGQLADTGCLHLLVPDLAHPAQEVVLAAIATLGRTGRLDASDKLLALVENDHTPQIPREKGGQSLLMLCEKLQQSDPARARQIFERVWQSPLSIATRRGALRGAVVNDAQGELWGTLLEQLDADSIVGPSIAARLFRDFPPEVLTEERLRTLLPPFRQNEGDVKTVLLDTLVTGSDELASEAITAALESRQVAVQRTVLQVIERDLQPTHVATLARMATQRGIVADEAREILATAPHNCDLEIIRQLAQGEDADTRVELLRAVMVRSPEHAALICLPHTHDDSPRVRAMAYRGVAASISPDQAQAWLPALATLLLHQTDRRVQQAGEEALLTVLVKCADAKTALTCYEPLLAECNAAEALPLLASAARVGGPVAQRILRRALRRSEPEWITVGLRAASQWDGIELTDDFARLAVGEGAMQARAIRALLECLRNSKTLLPDQRFLGYKEALKLSSRDEERRMALGALTSVPRDESLRLAQQYLKSESLQEEAAFVTASLARSLCSQSPQLARTALEEIQQVSKSPQVRSQVLETLKLMHDHAGFIGAWLVCGPFQGDSAAELFDAQLPPEIGQGVWQSLPVKCIENPWILDLVPLDSASQRAAYLRTEIFSDVDRAVVLELGSDDGIKVWLNHELVHENPAMRALAPASDRVEVTLKAGWNPLLLKVVQGAGGWGACCAVRAIAEDSLDALRFRAE